MDKICVRNPSNLEVTCRCGDEEKNEWPHRTNKSNMLTIFKNKLPIAIYRLSIQTIKCHRKVHISIHFRAKLSYEF